jgi:hypothetical protein
MPQILGAVPLVLKGYSRLCAYSRSMAIGDKLAFKHIAFNVKLQYPFNRRQVFVCARARSALVRAHVRCGVPKGA